MDRETIISVLDVGSSCSRVLVGRMGVNGMAEILGLGHAPCSGVDQGAVIDISATRDSISAAVRDAELTSGHKVYRVYLSTGGVHISGRGSHGSTSIKESEVGRNDVEEAISAAKAMAFPRDELLLHALAQSFSIDKQTKVRKPLGMVGERLDVDTYLISGVMNMIHNLQKCVASCNLMVERIVVDQIADSHAVLQQDEREAGVCILNIGSGSAKTIVFRSGAPVFIGTGIMGGDNVTNDLSVALRQPTRVAEENKKRYGCAMVNKVPADCIIQMAQIDDKEKRTINRQTLASFIQPRYEEILNLVNEQLMQEHLKERINAGLVLVGGAARMEGLEDLAAEVMHIPARIGYPLNIQNDAYIGKNPQWTTAVGLLLYGLEQRMHQRHNEGFFNNLPLPGNWNYFGKIQHWLERTF